MIGNVPRNRRVVIDCDGKYNDAIHVDGDTNHRDAAASRQWTEICDSLADKIFQYDLAPFVPQCQAVFLPRLRSKLGATAGFWQQAVRNGVRRQQLVPVGPMQRVLQAIEPIRPRVGRLGVIGFGWNELPFDHDPNAPADAYRNDPAFLRRLRVEVMPPVRFDQVIPWMGRGVFSPVIYRPLFDNLRLATCRTFSRRRRPTRSRFLSGRRFRARDLRRSGVWNCGFQRRRSWTCLRGRSITSAWSGKSGNTWPSTIPTKRGSRS